MKYIFLLPFLLISSLIFSQNEIQADLLLSADSVQTPKIKYIRCGASIASKEPLVIIDGLPVTYEHEIYKNLNTEDIVSIDVLKDAPAVLCYGSAGRYGVVLISTKHGTIDRLSTTIYPFKTYKIWNNHWTTLQDMFNAITAKVPGVQIDNTYTNNIATNIKMRGSTNTIVIVDGIRQDASILNQLNPSDIESIEVSNNLAAQNYFVNN